MSSELTRMQFGKEARSGSVAWRRSTGCLIGSGMELAWELLTGLLITFSP